MISANAATRFAGTTRTKESRMLTDIAGNPAPATPETASRSQAGAPVVASAAAASRAPQWITALPSSTGVGRPRSINAP